MNNQPQNTILATCAVILTCLIGWFILSQPTKPNVSPHYVPNYPLNMDVTSYIGKPDLDEEFVSKDLSDKLISVFHNVTYDEKELKYIYNYKISFSGKKKCYLAWEILDQMLNNNVTVDVPPKADAPALVALEPGVVREFKITSNSPPILGNGTAWIYKSKKLSDDNVIWELIKLNSQPGPLPVKFNPTVPVH